jgi:threonine aldolase
MEDDMAKYNFSCDYLEGAHPKIMQRMAEINTVQEPGYGTDSVSESAREKIRSAVGIPDAEVYFLVGGTQTNAVVIDGILRRYEGVLAASTGHIAVHEAGAIEYCGHKVLPVPGAEDKIMAEQLDACLRAFFADDNRDHMVQPGMVYISQPTEFGSLYSAAELAALHQVCLRYQLPLYVDGARLAYALAAPENDVTLPMLAANCEAFYIGGTKCGAWIGEAVVFPKRGLVPHFFTLIKEHGALLAKGRLIGLQFDTLFTDNLYLEAGQNAIREARKIRRVLRECGYRFYAENPTNQILLVLPDAQYRAISREVELGFWEKADASHTVARIATSWATTGEKTEYLCGVLRKYAE